MAKVRNYKSPARKVCQQKSGHECQNTPHTMAGTLQIKARRRGSDNLHLIDQELNILINSTDRRRKKTIKKSLSTATIVSAGCSLVKMNRNQFAKDYLTFTRKERIGLLALVFAIILVVLLPKAIRNTRPNNYPTADTSWITAMRKLEVKSSENERDNYKREPAENEYAYHFERTVNKSTQAPVLFYFDPNTLDEGGWLKLGLKNKTIHTIQNFVSKGGHFYKPEDLKRIYGLHPDEFARLEPYVKIAGSIAH